MKILRFLSRLRHAAVLGGLISSLPQVALATELTAWRSGGRLGDFQIQIAKLQPGEELRLPPGVVQGPIVIRTPGVTIDGGSKTEITGGGEGTVVTIAADRVTLRNVKVSGSGQKHEHVDAGVSVRKAHGVRLENLEINDALFGVDIEYSHDVVISKSRIASKNLELGMRGDAIRIHSSRNILVADNHWREARDVVAWYSEGVTFQGNLGETSRYSLHSMYTKRLTVQDNEFDRNGVGIFLMYGSGMTIRNNIISHSLGATGIGIGLKETSGVFVQDNTIVYCASGILVDNSPWDPGTRNWFYRNTVAFSSQGVVLSNDRAGNEFRENKFQGNLQDVRAESRATSPSTWEGNTWDKYAGFDRNADGIGDTPYVLYHYADGLDDSHSFTGFFFGSPVQLLIETVNRLVPLTDPRVIASDPKPRLVKQTAQRRAKP